MAAGKGPGGSGSKPQRAANGAAAVRAMRNRGAGDSSEARSERGERARAGSEAGLEGNMP